MRSSVKKIVTGIAALGILLSLVAVSHVYAAAPYDPSEGLKVIGGAAGFNTSSDSSQLPKTIGTLLNVVIGTLGFVFLVLAVYAGFKIMLSQGGEGYKTGKQTLLYAVIGMVIIASAYALSTFVVGQLSGV